MRRNVATKDKMEFVYLMAKHYCSQECAFAELAIQRMAEMFRDWCQRRVLPVSVHSPGVR